MRYTSRGLRLAYSCGLGLYHNSQAAFSDDPTMRRRVLMLTETDSVSCLVRSFLRALRACDLTSRTDRVATTKETVAAKLRESVSFADDE